MTSIEILRTVLGLALVAGLIGLVALGVRRWGDRSGAPARGRGRRVTVVETRQVDPKRRLILVRRDDVEHLLLIGGDADLVVERNIPVTDPMAGADTPVRVMPGAGYGAAGTAGRHDPIYDDDEDDGPVLRVDRRGGEPRHGLRPQTRRIPPELDR
ncbi:hypothetical protein GCM10011505_03690 [Tistrella bauzanensis]|uniref:Flagellar biosynthesis protein FliO n=1 Tax=Tistrella bauzanensis TaxID=657419 RepID=A0ABQ1I950_9PROT|nr:flagellar biosynthetic protein FliO [Tistrella bauzanensis]GGB25743.1 hypothetical protein GCM10011505_03690 [Tistrella bauzanensis]